MFTYLIWIKPKKFYIFEINFSLNFLFLQRKPQRIVLMSSFAMIPKTNFGLFPMVTYLQRLVFCPIFRSDVWNKLPAVQSETHTQFLQRNLSWNDTWKRFLVTPGYQKLLQKQTISVDFLQFHRNLKMLDFLSCLELQNSVITKLFS